MFDLLESSLQWFVYNFFSLKTLGVLVIIISFAWVVRSFEQYFNKRFSRIEMMLMYMNEDPRYEEKIRELFRDEEYKI